MLVLNEMKKKKILQRF